MYSFDETRNLYLTIAKGYKSGGFNTQMFSDVLQQKMMNRMGIGEVYDVQRADRPTNPNTAGTTRLGGHFSCMEGAVRGDFALFYIDCPRPAAHRLPAGTDHRPHDDQRRAHAQSSEPKRPFRFAPWRTLRHQHSRTATPTPGLSGTKRP